MAGPAVDIRGFISRLLPAASQDDPEQTKLLRASRYREQYSLSPVRKQHLLADEGSYFVVNNGQAGILGSPAVAFVATTPLAIIVNTDSPSNPNAKRIYLDYLALITSVVGSAASGLVNLQMAAVIDQGNRYSSGGTDLSSLIVSPNMDLPKSLSVAKFYFGALTAVAASLSARTVTGLRILRPSVSATVLDVVGEQKLINFGGVEGVMNGSVTVANANNIPVALPPIILGPNQSLLIYVWQNNGATNVAATYAPEAGWWER